MSKQLSRRQFVGAGAGVAVAASLGGATVALGRKERALKESVPPKSLGIQHFSIRDATARLSIASQKRRLAANPAAPAVVQGYLGGPNYPEDPTDLGPLVDLPGGYAEVFEFLASVGYAGFEFFQSTQNANEFAPANPNPPPDFLPGGRQPTFAEIRSYLDAAGLVAQGTHQFGLGNFDPLTGNLTPAGETNFANFQSLGMPTMGFSGNLSNLATAENQVNPVTGAITYGFAARCEHVSRIGEILASRGVQFFYHPEQDNYRYFADPVHPELNDVHRIQYVLENADPNYFKLELDYLHNYAGRARFRTPDPANPTGPGVMDISIWRMIQDDPKRLMGFHLKDGDVNPNWRVGAPITGTGETGGGVYNQTFLRTPTFTDTFAPLEGDLGQGTPEGFDTDNRGMKKYIDKTPGKYVPLRHHIVESDSGPGPTTGPTADPGRSLRHAYASAKALLALRG